VVICLERGADLHMAQLMPLPLTVSCFSKIQIGLPFWYRLTRVVPEKGPLNGCVLDLEIDRVDRLIRSIFCRVESIESSEREVESVDNIDSKSTFGSGADTTEHDEQ